MFFDSMASFWTLCLTGVRSSLLWCGSNFVSRGGISESVFWITSTIERSAGESKSGCVTSRHPASWSSFIPWLEYAHNSLTFSATGMSPFMASFGYQPPLFREQEVDRAVPSVQENLQWIRRVWSAARTALLRARSKAKYSADRHRVPAPSYQDRKCGCRLGTSPFKRKVRSWHQDSLVRMKWRR